MAMIGMKTRYNILPNPDDVVLDVDEFLKKLLEEELEDLEDLEREPPPLCDSTWKIKKRIMMRSKKNLIFIRN